MYSKEIIEGINRIGIEYFIYLPCSTIKDVIHYFLDKPGVVSIPVSREEEGFQILAGLTLGGSKGILVIQDSGLGNSILTLVSLLDIFHIPAIVIVARRGGVGEINVALAAFSSQVEKMLENNAIKYTILDEKTDSKQWSAKILAAHNSALLNNRPHLILVNNMS